MSVGTKKEETPKWRFAVIVWIAIYPAVTLAQYLLSDFMQGWPIYQKTLIISIIEIPYAVFFALPLLQKAFKGWLKGGSWGDD